MEDNLRNLVDANRLDIAKLNNDVTLLQDCVTTLFKNQRALESNQIKLGACCALGFLGATIGMTALLFGYSDLACEPKTKVTIEKRYYLNENEEEIKSEIDDVK